MNTQGELVWCVYSTAPNEARPVWRRTFEYDAWQFAEKVAQYLRGIGHEDVRVELAIREE